MHRMEHRRKYECSNVRKRPPRAGTGGQPLRWRSHGAPNEISWLVKSTKRQKTLYTENILNNREMFLGSLK
jgi:hypothetical protein